MLKIIGKGASGKFTAEELAVIDLESIKKMISERGPVVVDEMKPISDDALDAKFTYYKVYIKQEECVRMNW